LSSQEIERREAVPAVKYDFNQLEMSAVRHVNSGDYKKALNIYLFMADGDPSLDGGYLGKRIAQCYEAMKDFHAANNGTVELWKKTRSSMPNAKKPGKIWATYQ
jgi:hypothetical protein